MTTDKSTSNTPENLVTTIKFVLNFAAASTQTVVCVWCNNG